jgi:uncharacterized protein YajQ (UPF0234 family)
VIGNARAAAIGRPAHAAAAAGGIGGVQRTGLPRSSTRASVRSVGFSSRLPTGGQRISVLQQTGSLMPSFDIVSEVNQVEVRNAVDQANKEIGTRFDFKGSDARAEYDGKVLTLFADDDFKLKQVTDIVVGKLAKRQVDIRALKYGTVERIAGNKVKQVVTVRTGVEQELAKKIVKLLKDSKLKVQGSIQGDAIRVSGAKKDVLQEAIALTRKSITDFPLQYQNFRD